MSDTSAVWPDGAREAAIDHAVLSALAAIRAENERLRREVERQPPEGGTER